MNLQVHIAMNRIESETWHEEMSCSGEASALLLRGRGAEREVEAKKESLSDAQTTSASPLFQLHPAQSPHPSHSLCFLSL